MTRPLCRCGGRQIPTLPDTDPGYSDTRKAISAHVSQQIKKKYTSTALYYNINHEPNLRGKTVHVVFKGTGSRDIIQIF
jgi:hypothetical protein